MIVRRRHVLFLAGFDPIDGPAQHRRFQREAGRFARTWSLSADVSGLAPAVGQAGARWHLDIAGPDWATQTVYEPLDWHSVVEAELARPRRRHLFGGLVAFLDFVVSGTAWRYFVASWQYGLFFLLPFFNLLAFTVIAIAAGVLVASGLSGAPAAVAGIAVALAVFAGLMRWPGGRWRVEQALADWIFAREYMQGRRPDVEALLDRFADRLIGCARAADCDELIVVGHSLGATFAVDVIARALVRDPELTRRGPAIGLLTVGATIPKLALHPGAAQLRAAIARVAQSGIAWTEFQARRDPISFYRFDPVTLRRFEDNAPGRQPRIMLVGLKDMLTEETYQLYKMNHMRLHYQFVMGNERRAAYDYFMLIGGPAPFAFLSALPKGALDAFGPDGAWVMRPPAGANAVEVRP